MERLLVVSLSDDFLQALAACPPVSGALIVPATDIPAAVAILASSPLRAVIVDLATIPAPAALTLAEQCRIPITLVPAGTPLGPKLLTASLNGAHSPDRAPTGPSKGQVWIGALLVDRIQWRVELHHQEISLSSREFRLLDYFVRHANQVMSREAIISHVWSPTFDGTDRVVDVCLSRLRRQVFDRPDCPVLVRAIPGVGYKLITKSVTDVYDDGRPGRSSGHPSAHMAGSPG